MRRTAVVAIVMAAGAPAPLQAQGDITHFRTHRYLGIGYVISAPHMFAGVNGLWLQAGGFGLYADFKLTTNSPGDEATCCPYTIEEAEAFGDLRFQDKSAWRSVNAAIVRVVGPQVAVYGGGGMSRERAYRRYVDLNDVRDAYWVEDPRASGNRVNVLGGVLFHASRHLLFVFGGELRPRGVTVGLTLGLPR